MFDNIDQLKIFIEWSIEKGLKRAKIGEIEFEISDYGLTKHLIPIDQVQQNKDPIAVDNSGMTKEDEELLLWSAK